MSNALRQPPDENAPDSLDHGTTRAPQRPPSTADSTPARNGTGKYVKQLSKDARRKSILDAAQDILNSGEPKSLTMPEIATRLGVTRQVLYLHFHGIDDVLEALYDRTFEEYFADLGKITGIDRDMVGGGVARLERILDLPEPIHQIIYSAFFASPTSSPAQLTLQRRLYRMMEENWMSYLREIGLDEPIALAGLYSIFSTTLVYRELINRRLITRSDAHRQQRRLMNSLFRNPSYRPS